MFFIQMYNSNVNLYVYFTNALSRQRLMCIFRARGLNQKPLKCRDKVEVPEILFPVSAPV